MSTVAQGQQRQAHTSDSNCPTPEELYITEPPPNRGKKSAAGWLRKRGNRTPASHQQLDDNGTPRQKQQQQQQHGGDEEHSTLLNLEGERFPSYEELQLLPVEIRETLLVLVMDFFRQMFYPRMMVIQKKRYRKQLRLANLPTAPTVPIAFLQSVPFFSRWNNLDSVVRALELEVYERDEFLTFEGDPTQSAIFFLVHGTLHARKRNNPGAGGGGGSLSTGQGSPQSLSPRAARVKNRQFVINKKRINAHTTTVTQIYEGLCVYGEKIFLTEEPRLESLKAATKVLVWVLKKKPFFELLNALPPERKVAVTDYAFVQRRENIPKVFPLSGGILRKVPLFAHIPIHLLDNLAPRLEPRVYGANQKICEIGDLIANEMFFIVRGNIGVSVASLEGKTTQVQVAKPGSIVGEASVLFTQKRQVTLIAKVPCDVYVITRDVLTGTIQNSALIGEMLKKAHAQQTEWQQHAKTQFVHLLQQVPFLKQLASEKCISKLLDASESKVYPLRSTILSVSECANKLVIFTRGKARISATSVDLRIGESLGFTCLVPHRWAYHVVAQETVESLEISYTRFKAILREFKIYDEVKELCMGLIYPRAHPESFQRALGMVRHCHNPPCFPTSAEPDPKPFAARVTIASPSATAGQHENSTRNEKEEHLGTPPSPDGDAALGPRETLKERRGKGKKVLRPVDPANSPTRSGLSKTASVRLPPIHGSNPQQQGAELAQRFIESLENGTYFKEQQQQQQGGSATSAARGSESTSENPQKGDSRKSSTTRGESDSNKGTGGGKGKKQSSPATSSSLRATGDSSLTRNKYGIPSPGKEKQYTRNRLTPSEEIERLTQRIRELQEASIKAGYTTPTPKRSRLPPVQEESGREDESAMNDQDSEAKNNQNDNANGEATTGGKKNSTGRKPEMKSVSVQTTKSFLQQKAELMKRATTKDAKEEKEEEPVAQAKKKPNKEQDEAVLVLQNSLRRRAAQRKIEHKRKESATLQMQCAIRSRSAEKSVERKREEENTNKKKKKEVEIVKLQSAIRMALARKAVERRRAEQQQQQQQENKNQDNDAEKENTNESKEEGNVDNNQEKTPKEEEETERKQREEKEAAAVKIQCSMRRKAAREETTERRQNSTNELHDE